VAVTPHQVRAAFAGLAMDSKQALARVARFESAFANRLGVGHAVATGSGKAALACILEAAGALPGDGVVLSSFNVPEVVAVLVSMGLRPRFADIEPGTFGLDPESVERAVDRNTRFLIATHLYGNPCRLRDLESIARRHGILVIEDAAQALGASLDGRPVGAQGHPALFSFGPMKNLNTFRGGMITTDDAALAARVRNRLADRPAGRRLGLALQIALVSMVRVATTPRVFSSVVFPILRAAEAASPTLLYGLAKMRPADYDKAIIDLDSVIRPMGPGEASAGLAALDELDDSAARRIANARRLARALDGIPGISFQRQVRGGDSAWTQFVVQTPDRAVLKSRLLRAGIDTTWGYLMACHRIPGLETTGDDHPASLALEAGNLHLPAGPDLDDHDIDRLANAVMNERMIG
jgi:dTDP-4-amino-4,6-dideoxygalactose transaminase